MNGKKLNRYALRAYKAFLSKGDGGGMLPVCILKFPEDLEDGEVLLRVLDDGSPESVLDDYIIGERASVLVDVAGGRMDVYSAEVSHHLALTIALKNAELEKVVERRGELKVPFRGQGEIWSPIGAGKERTTRVWFRDISASGVGFDLDSESDVLNVGEVWSMKFDRGPDTIDVDFEICRKVEKPDGKIECGAQFVRLNAKKEAVLRRYAFEVEKEERLRARRIQERLEDR